MTSRPETTSPAVAKLIGAADELIAIAKELRAQGREAECLTCAAAAGEYVRAARAMQDMENAFKAARSAGMEGVWHG